ADVLLGDDATDDLVLEDEALTRLGRRDVDDHVTVLTTPTRLADELALDVLRGAADRLAVRHLRAANVRVDLELATKAVDDDLEMELAHPADDRLTRLLVRVDAERRVLLR